MKLWAVLDEDGEIIDLRLFRSRREAIVNALLRRVIVIGKHPELRSLPSRWKNFYRYGYRCKRITVTVEGES